MSDFSVMVVDDDPDVREVMMEAITFAGADVSSAENGRAALDRLLGGARPSVILLDLMMPEMDGWAFRAEQRRHPELAGIPVIVFSAHRITQEIVRALDAQAYLSKPSGLDELIATLARFR
jgi:CheY-like chemotaxis protein